MQLVELVEIQLRSRTILRHTGHLRTVLLLCPESELKVLSSRSVHLDQTQGADAHI